MTRWLARACVVLLAVCALPAMAQTRAWLDRAQVTYGETATLNIETSDSVQQVDYRPLATQFDVGGQTVRRSLEIVNGRSRAKSLFAVGLRPRGPGVLTVPALRVGGTMTTPLRLVVLPPSVQPAGSDADAFVETVIDAAQPYVQQSVGLVVRLHVAVPLLSGQLDQDDVAGASLQRVGEDIQYQREIGRRRYTVIERRYLLIPERSGALVVPGARFNGQGVGGFFDDLFGDGRKALSAAAPTKRLQVQAIPAAAAQPWLPLRDLRLRYAQLPRTARMGEAATIEVEAIADGARASQLPLLAIAETPDAQVFADPAQSDEQFIEGRPRTTLRRRIAIVPLKAGAVSLPGPRIEWWDAVQGVARTAMLPPVQLQVAPGIAPSSSTADAGNAADGGDAVDRAGAPGDVAAPPTWVWVLAGLAMLLAALAWRGRRRAPPQGDAIAEASVVAPATPAATSLASALRGGDLAQVAQALCADAGLADGDLDAVRARLEDAAQRDAVERLQSARWGGGDAADALAVMRTAFANGARWRASKAKRAPVLPPLYPE